MHRVISKVTLASCFAGGVGGVWYAGFFPLKRKAPKHRDYTLHFFPLRARGELCRLIFAKANVPYEDHRVSWEDFPHVKPDTPFGKLPVLEIDGRKFSESFALARFLANEFDLNGHDCLDHLKCDMICDVIKDQQIAILRFRHESDEKRKNELASKYKKEALPQVLAQLEDKLEPSGFFVGNNITWVDLAFFDWCMWIDAIGETDQIPTKLKTLRAVVAADPGIAEWVKKRPKSDF